jgi:hypothetical protein
MSHSEYYLFRVDGTISEVTRMGNGFGSGPVLWTYLCKKYLGPNSMWMMDIRKFWKEGLDKTLPADDRFLLYMTYDQALVPRAEFRRAAELLSKCPVDGGVNHWPEIVKMLNESADDADILGFGFYATSVADNVWKFQDDTEEGEMHFKDARTAPCVQYGAPDLVSPQPVVA